MKIARIILTSLLCVTTLFAGSKYPKEVGQITGAVIHESGAIFPNALVLIHTKHYQLLDEEDNRFVISDAPATQWDIEIHAHDPLLGNFLKEIEDVVVTPNQITELGTIILKETNRVKNINGFFPLPLNQEITINRFPFNSIEKPLGETKDIVIFEKIGWQSIVQTFGTRILEEYRHPSLQEQHIAIIGYASSDEGDGDYKTRIKLGLQRAMFVRDFFYRNFNVSRKLFFVSSGTAMQKMKTKSKFFSSDKDRRVKILFYSEVQGTSTIDF